MNIPLSPYVPENLVSRDGFSRPVPRQPTHLYTQAESGGLLTGFLPSSAGASIYETAIRHRVSPEFIGARNCVSMALTAESRHRASKPQGSSERVLPWQVTMDQLICASLSHTHYWYEVGMLKVHKLEVQLANASERLAATSQLSLWELRNSKEVKFVRMVFLADDWRGLRAVPHRGLG